ncbi:hypothetical protein An07g00660 [Aspergillus niger]|uniref:Uncharacterized protein n=2 Tax=Aspergillus niger TaxID=5061 RepID=A2QM35_ASPNC|nr:hypothetical protein An07g00660 [Aspergillus niger]CAK39289.1 hypothetical protein An07g00660 [Aspergillus niger]
MTPTGETSVRSRDCCIRDSPARSQLICTGAFTHPMLQNVQFGTLGMRYTERKHCDLGLSPSGRVRGSNGILEYGIMPVGHNYWLRLPLGAGNVQSAVH